MMRHPPRDVIFATPLRSALNGYPRAGSRDYVSRGVFLAATAAYKYQQDDTCPLTAILPRMYVYEVSP
jgi:hypothetical protein